MRLYAENIGGLTQKFGLNTGVLPSSLPRHDHQTLYPVLDLTGANDSYLTNLGGFTHMRAAACLQIMPFNID